MLITGVNRSNFALSPLFPLVLLLYIAFSDQKKKFTISENLH